MKATVKAKHDRFADVSLVFFGFLPSFFFGFGPYRDGRSVALFIDSLFFLNFE